MRDGGGEARKKLGLLAALLALLPLPAHASGDPGILFEICFLFCWHAAGAAFVLFSRRIRRWRLELCGLYFAGTVPLWHWYLTSPGPHFTLQPVVMALYPPALIALFAFATRARRAPGR